MFWGLYFQINSIHFWNFWKKKLKCQTKFTSQQCNIKTKIKTVISLSSCITAIAVWEIFIEQYYITVFDKAWKRCRYVLATIITHYTFKYIVWELNDDLISWNTVLEMRIARGEIRLFCEVKIGFSILVVEPCTVKIITQFLKQWNQTKIRTVWVKKSFPSQHICFWREFHKNSIAAIIF